MRKKISSKPAEPHFSNHTDLTFLPFYTVTILITVFYALRIQFSMNNVLNLLKQKKGKGLWGRRRESCIEEIDNSHYRTKSVIS
jgi:hypothetical protein